MFNLYNALVYLFECDKQYQTKTYLILAQMYILGKQYNTSKTTYHIVLVAYIGTI